MSKIYKATFLLMIATLVSKVLGFCRELALTYTYGATTISDVYITAINVPTMLVMLIGSILTTSFIPLFFEVEKESKEKALNFANNVLNITIIISIFIVIFASLFMEELIGIFAINFSGERLVMAVDFTRVTIIGVLFLALSNFMTAWLHIRQEFTIPGLIASPYNLLTIIFIIISGFTNINVMIYGTLIAIASQFIFQLPFAIKYGFKYKFYIDLKDKYLKKMIILIIPVFIGVGVNQLNAIIDRSLASTLEEGTITILNSASRLNGFVISIFITTIVSVIYPRLSLLSNDDENKESFIQAIYQSINMVIILIIPISIGAIILSKPVVRIVFERGAFDSYATYKTSIALVCYCIGMIGFSLRDILNRVFYSIQETKIPMINGTVSVILNIALNIILIRFLDYIGLALATSISSLICIVLLLRSLNKKIGYFGQDKILNTFIKVLICSIIMGLITYTTYHILPSGTIILELISILVSVLVGVCIYLFLLYLLKLDEMYIIINMIKLKLTKK